MASSNPDVPHNKSSKKGKQKKGPSQASAATDGAPGPSVESHVTTNSPPTAQADSNLKSGTQPTQRNKEDGGSVSNSKAPLAGAAGAGKDGAPSKDKQQKKLENKEKQSKAQAQSKPDGAKPAEGGEAGGGEGDKPKSKAQLKAERRAIQERQRAMKDAKKSETTGGASGSGGAGGKKDTLAKKESDPSSKTSTTAAATSESSGKAKTSRPKKTATNVDYHTLSSEEHWLAKEKEMLTRGSKIDNSIFNLGLQYLHQKIVGADARCVALLTTLKEVIGKYKTPEEKELTRDLEKNFLAPCIKYISDCRPLSTSMGNAIKHLKQQINQIPQGTEDKEAIAILHEAIDNFIDHNITKAAEAVAVYANHKIDDGDVILIYAASSLIAQVLKFAHSKGKQFRVIVVEGRPRTEGKTMLRYLVRCGIPCSYIYIGSAAHAMSETTKVFLGAAAMFAIGDMHSRTGNAMIAALAKANNIPVLVCCETYKFTDKVQLSSSTSSQQARGKDLISIGHRPPSVPNYQEIDLHLLNVVYDVTPSRYITALVTELGMLPCTSVPVVLRRQEDKSSL